MSHRITSAQRDARTANEFDTVPVEICEQLKVTTEMFVSALLKRNVQNLRQ